MKTTELLLNKKTLRPFSIVVALLFLSMSGIAQSPGHFAIQTDQDFLFRFPFSKNEDRNYTQGTCFTYSHKDLPHSIFFWPVKKLNEYDQDFVHYSSSVSIGGTAFTPRIIDSINPIVGDRPFAFLFYVSTSSTYIKEKNIRKIGGADSSIQVYNTFNINYGVFGTKLGYEFQSFAHKNIVKGRPVDPKGWDTQISKGGQPTLLVEYNRFRPLLSIAGIYKHHKFWDPDRSLLDMGLNLGGSVGYYDRLAGGLYLRIGHLKRANQARWNGGWSSLNSASFMMLNPATPPKHTFEYFAYGRVTATAMLRNSMLVGQRFFSSQYTLNPEWAKTGLIEYEWGGVFAWDHQRPGETGLRTWAIQFRTVYRSPEFNSKIFPERWHYFGGLGLLIPVY